MSLYSVNIFFNYIYSYTYVGVFAFILQYPLISLNMYVCVYVCVQHIETERQEIIMIPSRTDSRDILCFLTSQKTRSRAMSPALKLKTQYYSIYFNEMNLTHHTTVCDCVHEIMIEIKIQ